MNPTTKDNLRKLLKHEPQCASSTNLLVVRYWMMFDNVQQFTDCIDATSAESITRAFRTLVSEDPTILNEKSSELLLEQENALRKLYGGKPRQQLLDFKE